MKCITELEIRDRKGHIQQTCGNVGGGGCSEMQKANADSSDRSFEQGKPETLTKQMKSFLLLQF